jgi:hypothetical protein
MLAKTDKEVAFRSGSPPTRKETARSHESANRWNSKTGEKKTSVPKLFTNRRTSEMADRVDLRFSVTMQLLVRGFADCIPGHSLMTRWIGILGWDAR